MKRRREEGSPKIRDVDPEGSFYLGYLGGKKVEKRRSVVSCDSGMSGGRRGNSK